MWGATVNTPIKATSITLMERKLGGEPGIFLKSLGGRHISLTVFALSQLAMDLEVLVRVAGGAERWHGFTNTFIGAAVVLLPTVFLGKPAGEWVLRWWNRNLSPTQARWLEVQTRISWPAAWIGGVLGVFSHVILDAVMHADAIPGAPFSAANPYVGLLSIGQLNLLCLIFLLLGTVIIGVTRWFVRRRSGGDPLRSELRNST